MNRNFEVHFRLTLFVQVVVNFSCYNKGTFFYHGATASSGPRPPHCRGCMIILRHTTLGRTALDEWSVRRRNLYLTTHNTHNRETSIPPVRFEPAIPASKRPQTHTLERAATGIDKGTFRLLNISKFVSRFEHAAGHECCESFSPPTVTLHTVYGYAILTSLAWDSSVKLRSGILYWGMLYFKKWAVMNYIWIDQYNLKIT
jgi:hypothetical protein